MYSLLRQNRLATCKTLLSLNGDRLTFRVVRNHCVLCGPQTHHSRLLAPRLSYRRSTSHEVPTNVVIYEQSWRWDQATLKQKLLSDSLILEGTRTFHTSAFRFSEPRKPSSKVEETVKALKEAKPPAEDSSAVVKSPKKPLKQRIIDELVHYYHGFRLLFIDISISIKLLWKILQGKSLTRREHKLLVRTVGDMFRLVPFSVFIIVPFLEFLLPFFIKFFPGMLPSTFQTANEIDDKLKASLKVKLEMAKFLQETLDELPVVSKGGHSCEAAKEFAEFFQKVRTSGGMTPTEDIMKFSKLFQDELTLDSLPRPQLMALCRVLEINPIGPTNVLRFKLRLKVRSLTADDLMIQKEGIDSLSQSELQAACRTRGMRALGVSEARLRAQLEQWLDLSLVKKVPPSLLLLSQAFMLPDTIPTSEKLAQTISALPDAVGTKTKAVIGEREGKVDNKTKIELIQEEVKAIREEKKELQEEQEKAAREKKAREDKEELIDEAPIISDTAPMFPELREAINVLKKAPISSGTEPVISAKDIQALDEALDLLGKHKNDLMVEKEELEDLKQEMSEYQEDIADLQALECKEVRETKAAQRLYKKVSRLMKKVDASLNELEALKTPAEPLLASDSLRTKLSDKANDGMLQVDELIAILEKMEIGSHGLESISRVLAKIDSDKDGLIRIDVILKIIELVGNDNIPLSEKQVEELITLVKAEEAIELDDQIAKALNMETAPELEDTRTASGEDPCPPPSSQPEDSTSKKCSPNQSTNPIPLRPAALAEPNNRSAPVSEPPKSDQFKMR